MPWELCLFCIAQICEISWGKDRGKMCTSFCLHFWHKILLKNLRKKFWCKKITNRIAQKNKNHPANVCTVFVQILHFTKISPKNCGKKNEKKLWILYANMTGNVTSFAGNVNFLFPSWISCIGVWFEPFSEIFWNHFHPERVVSFKERAERGWKSGARSLSWKSGWNPCTLATSRRWTYPKTFFRFRERVIWKLLDGVQIRFYIKKF